MGRPELLIVGSGIAGLYVALRAVEEGLRPVILTKSDLTESNTRYAQGGIAAAIGDDDSPYRHYLDTLRAGGGLVDSTAARVLTREAPERIADLIRLGVPFDTVDGHIALGREGGHGRNRILHARGDQTGLAIEETLQERVRQSGIDVREGTALREIRTERGTFRSLRIQGPRGEEELEGDRLVLATGGAGSLYRETSNPRGATGEGVAIALRAGAWVRDMEFIQFHPTVLHKEGAPRFLLTEALRGEGAHLVNIRGERFMPRYHPRADLAPRDVVSRAIVSEMKRTGAPVVYLDARHIPANRLRLRFPNITVVLQRFGLDLTRDRIPVSPMAHYMVGGVATNLDGETSVRGMYACGEVASTGIHGANRLASNSLLEGLVFGERIVRTLRDGQPWRGISPSRRVLRLPWPRAPPSPQPMEVPDRASLGRLLWDKVGIVREGPLLRQAAEELGRGWAYWEATGDTGNAPPAPLADLFLTGYMIAVGALTREESRGVHYRIDFPRSRPSWKCHLDFSRA